MSISPSFPWQRGRSYPLNSARWTTEYLLTPPKPCRCRTMTRHLRSPCRTSRWWTYPASSTDIHCNLGDKTSFSNPQPFKPVISIHRNSPTTIPPLLTLPKSCCSSGNKWLAIHAIIPTSPGLTPWVCFPTGSRGRVTSAPPCLPIPHLPCRHWRRTPSHRYNHLAETQIQPPHPAFSRKMRSQTRAVGTRDVIYTSESTGTYDTACPGRE